MRARLALGLGAAVAASAALVLAPNGSAANATALTFTDAAGDNKLPVAGTDIKSVTWDTAGVTTTKKVGKKLVKTYKPTDLVVSMTLDAAPSTTPGMAYYMWGSIAGCDGSTSYFEYTPGNQLIGESYASIGCGGDPADPLGGDTTFSDDDAIMTITGSVISFKIPLSALPPAVKLGAVVSGLEAMVDYEDAVEGSNGPGKEGRLLGFPDALAIDYVATDKTWKIA